MTRSDIDDALVRFRAQLPKAARLYVAGCSGEAVSLAAAFRSQPELAAGLTFLGVWIPGVNQTDWASFHPEARAESIFLSPALRPSFKAGKTRFLPLSYVQATVWLQATPLDGGVIMVSPPDADNMTTLGVSADFSDLILARSDVPLLAIVNEAMPADPNAARIPLSRFAEVTTISQPLIEVPSAPLSQAFDSLGQHLASLIDPGDTLQFGLGTVQQAVLQALTGHRELQVHAGMISDPLLGLLDSGAIRDGAGAVTTGVAIGTKPLYQRSVRDDRIRFRPVTYTHAISTLSRIDAFKAINSCIEVDLFGQANAEFINGRQISGAGGLVDFLRGAALSKGGRGIVALTATAKSGAISRIAPQLPQQATTINRADIDTVVTEYGVADLRLKSIDARAEALIAVAAPQFRDELANEWDKIRSDMS